ncbi:MAG: thioesterase domain-containing protein, partial [Chloroflexota bacterium]
VINLYNVTECGGVTTFFNFSNSEEEAQDSPNTLGNPIYNTRVFLLDDDGFPVNVGEVGQIIVSSVGTEQGYHNNTSLTGNFFAKDKLSTKSSSNSKLFRTGDYGRINDDGNLEFLGRKDKKIKVYGRHLDLENIAKVLKKQSQVKDAVIEASHNNRGQLAITAFLLVADQTYSVQNWRKYLLNQMPEYMIPTKIYQVKTNDRQSNLPLHDETMRLHMVGKRKSEAERQSKEPRDRIEVELLQIWSKILKREDVYINDDFFELGGNHVLAIQLTNKIQNVFDMSLDPGTVYRKPTISELSVLIREARHIKDRVEAISAAEFVESFTQKMKAINKEALQDNSKLLEIQKGLSTRPKFFCVHGEDGDISYLRHWIKYLGEQPFYAFQARTIIDGKKERYTSIEDIASNYLTELKEVQPRGPYYLGGYSTGGVIAFEMAQQLLKTGEQVALLGLVDSVNPLQSQKQSSFRDRFENLATAPASYLNGTLFKRLTGRNNATQKNDDFENNINHQTVISPNFRSVIFENYLNELVENYQITPFPGSILLITSTESGTMGQIAAVDRGWKGYSLSLKIHEIQGDRSALITDPNAKKVVTALLGHIDSVSKRLSVSLNR